MSADLLFSLAPSGPNLVFGASGSGSVAAQLTAQIAFPAFTFHAFVTPHAAISAQVAFPEFGAALGVSYDIAVDRPTASQAITAWQTADAARTGVADAWTEMAPLNAGRATRWQDAVALQQSSRAGWRESLRLRAGAVARHTETQRLGTHPIRSIHADAIRLRRGAVTAWQEGVRRRSGALATWREMDRSARIGRSSRWQTGEPVRASARTSFDTAHFRPHGAVSRWQEARLPPLGKWIPPAGPGTATGRTPDANLLFWKRIGDGPHLVFGWSPEEAGVVIPIRRTYIVYNTVTLKRTDSNAAVQALSLDISIDADSWLPSWSAEVAFHEWPALAAENGEPLEIEATVNGYTWLLLAEGAPARSRSFGKTGVRIRGRGIAAWLDAPAAASMSHYNASQMTAQQLMAQALTTNGVPLGWNLDWQITDWLVPEGAWSVQGTPIGGVLDVAGAVQAIVQADRAQQILHVLPRYPAAPWDWASLTPDVSIPTAVMHTDSLEPLVKPDYNAVYVSGQTQGIIGQVVRGGTAGDVLAPMVTHPLISHADAARQRGIAILGDSGRQARVSISMPIGSGIDLAEVGQLASIQDPGDPWVGLVRGVGVSARWEDASGLVVAQSVELERHYS